MQRDVVIISSVCTAIGSFGGSLKNIPPSALAGQVQRTTLARAGMLGEDIGHVVFG